MCHLANPSAMHRSLRPTRKSHPDLDKKKVVVPFLSFLWTLVDEAEIILNCLLLNISAMEYAVIKANYLVQILSFSAANQ